MDTSLPVLDRLLLKKWIHHQLSPSLHVIGSEKVRREVATYTGLTLECLFQPFGGNGFGPDSGVPQLNIDAENRPTVQTAPGATPAATPIQFLQRNKKAKAPPPTSSNPSSANTVREASIQAAYSPLSNAFVKVQDIQHGDPWDNIVSHKLFQETFDSHFEEFHSIHPFSKDQFSAETHELKPKMEVICNEPSLKILLDRNQTDNEKKDLDEKIDSSLKESKIEEQKNIPQASSGYETYMTSQILKMDTFNFGRFNLPWFKRWKECVMTSNRWATHESISSPVGVIIAISVNDERHVATFRNLLNAYNLSAHCQNRAIKLSTAYCFLIIGFHPDLDYTCAKKSINENHLRHERKSGHSPDCSSTNGEFQEAISHPLQGGYRRSNAMKRKQYKQEFIENIKNVVKEANTKFDPHPCTYVLLGDVTPLNKLETQMLTRDVSDIFKASLTISNMALPARVTTDVDESYSPSFCDTIEAYRDDPDINLEGIENCQNLISSMNPILTAASIPDNVNHVRNFCWSLTRKDMFELRNIIHNFINRDAMDWYELNLQQLSAQVASGRKGIKNQIKNFWRRSKISNIAEKAEQAGEAANTFFSAVGAAMSGNFSNLQENSGNKYLDAQKYAVDQDKSVNLNDWQSRLMGDLFFHIGLYDEALNNYRACSCDYKFEQGIMFMAGISEMIGVCLFLISGSFSVPNSHLNAAINSYLKCGSINFALRTWILQYHIRAICKGSHPGMETIGPILKIVDKLSEIQVQTKKTVSDVDLVISPQSIASIHMAVLLEQSGLCQLKLYHNHMRKAFFHQFLAATLYRDSGVPSLAASCYDFVLELMKAIKLWHSLSDYLNHTQLEILRSLNFAKPLFNVAKEIINDVADHFECDSLLKIPAIMKSYEYSDVLAVELLDEFHELDESTAITKEWENKALNTRAPFLSLRGATGNMYDRVRIYDASEEFVALSHIESRTRLLSKLTGSIKGNRVDPHFQLAKKTLNLKEIAERCGVTLSSSDISNLDWMNHYQDELFCNLISIHERKSKAFLYGKDLIVNSHGSFMTHANLESPSLQMGLKSNIVVEFLMSNPLNCVVTCDHIRLYGYVYDPDTGNEESFESNGMEFELEPLKSKLISLPLKLEMSGTYHIIGVRFFIFSGIAIDQTFIIHGPKVHDRQHDILYKNLPPDYMKRIDENQSLKTSVIPWSDCMSFNEYLLIPLGLPLQIPKWKFASVVSQAYKDDNRLVVHVSNDIPNIKMLFLNWPDCAKPSEIKRKSVLSDGMMHGSSQIVKCQVYNLSSRPTRWVLMNVWPSYIAEIVGVSVLSQDGSVIDTVPFPESLTECKDEMDRWWYFNKFHDMSRYKNIQTLLLARDGDDNFATCHGGKGKDKARSDVLSTATIKPEQGLEFIIKLRAMTPGWHRVKFLCFVELLSAGESSAHCSRFFSVEKPIYVQGHLGLNVHTTSSQLHASLGNIVCEFYNNTDSTYIIKDVRAFLSNETRQANSKRHPGVKETDKHITHVAINQILSKHDGLKASNELEIAPHGTSKCFYKMDHQTFLELASNKNTTPQKSQFTATTSREWKIDILFKWKRLAANSNEKIHQAGQQFSDVSSQSEVPSVNSQQETGPDTGFAVSKYVPIVYNEICPFTITADYEQVIAWPTDRNYQIVPIVFHIKSISPHTTSKLALSFESSAISSQLFTPFEIENGFQNVPHTLPLVNERTAVALKEPPPNFRILGPSKYYLGDLHAGHSINLTVNVYLPHYGCFHINTFNFRYLWGAAQHNGLVNSCHFDPIYLCTKLHTPIGAAA